MVHPTTAPTMGICPIRRTLVMTAIGASALRNGIMIQPRVIARVARTRHVASQQRREAIGGNRLVPEIT